MKRSLFGALFVALALALPGAAEAVAPVLLSVGHVDRHPNATWSLPPGVEAKVIEVATNPAAKSDGYFLSENVVSFSMLTPTQTSWTYAFEEDPGTYYVHVGGLDVPCYYDGDCPVREFSNVLTLVIDGSGGGQLPPTGTLPSPTGLRLVDRTLDSVTIAWSAPAGVTVDRYLIYRGGRQVGEVPGTVLEYEDSGLAPGSEYRYAVVAAAGAELSSPSAEIVARTLAPALSQARLAGSFRVTLRITAEHGLEDLRKGQRFTETWAFTPTCRAGACDARLRGEEPGGVFRLTLRRSGTRYEGQGRAALWSCFFSPVRGTLTVRLRVTAAGGVGGQWRATRFTGTLVDSVPGSDSGIFTCPPGTFTASLSGVLRS